MGIETSRIDPSFAKRFNEGVDAVMARGPTAAGTVASVRIARMMPDQLLVDPEPQEERTPGGIFIPESADARTARSDRGKVLMVGEGPLVAEMGIRVGDVVVIEAFSGSGTPVVVEGRPCFIFGADEVMAVLSPGEETTGTLPPIPPGSLWSEEPAISVVNTAALKGKTPPNMLIRSIQPVFDDIATRLKAIEDRESVLGELAKKMQALLDAMASPTREEFDAIMSAARPDVVARVTLLEDDPAAFTFKVGEMMKRAIGDGPPVVRKFVPLAPGETAPQTVVMPPEGMRWETDEELRARLKEFAPAEERRARPTAPPSSPETVQALTAKAPKADET